MFFSTSLKIGPDLALRGAAARGEDADHAVLLLVAEVEQPADLAPLVPPETILLTMHSPRPSTKSLPATILKSGRSSREAGWTPRMIMLLRVPLIALAVGNVEQFLGRQRRARLVSRSIPGSVKNLVGLGGLESSAWSRWTSPCGA